VKKWLLKPPVIGDILRLLLAWRVWVGGAVAGGIVATLIYLIFPPQYRAQATVLVDQNVEQVIPQERSDLLIDTYLARETDKLLELAWSDAVLSSIEAVTGMTVTELRGGVLALSQPGDGGWHFLARAADKDAAAEIASAWAGSFVDAMHAKPAAISSLLEVNFTREQDLPVERVVSAGVYIFCGALLGVTLLAFGLLFFDRKDS
jgi:hypothetical protein